MRVIISGSHTGDNPQPGVGIARSIRQAFPHAHLIALEHSRRSLGVHWPDFDEVWLEPDWSEVDLEQHACELVSRLTASDIWIPAQDVEVAWLAASGVHEAIMVPPAASVKRVAKSTLTSGGRLGDLRCPPSLGLGESPETVQDFCAAHDWRVWLKGPYYEAVRVRNWSELQEYRDRVERVWSTPDLFVQAHIDGVEESIAFAARKGRLLGAVRMCKREVSHEGKTWAGRILPLDGSEKSKVSLLLGDLSWTGGGEAEFVVDEAGCPWLIDFNTRFPAWIHGATLAGENLPAALVADVAGCSIASAENTCRDFVRVVLEIPARPGLVLSEPNKQPEPGDVSLSKHAAGMPLLAKGLADYSRTVLTHSHRMPRERSEPLATPRDLAAVSANEVKTPTYHFMAEDSCERFSLASRLAALAGLESEVEVVLAYSIKTNPDLRLLACALHAEMHAEAISQLEVELALSVGFAASGIVLNGPGKWWPADVAQQPVGTIFCDSLQEYQSLAESASRVLGYPAENIGLRLRPTGLDSRFGIDPEDLHEAFATTPGHLQGQAVALHFHCASSAIGIPNWWSKVDDFIAHAIRLESECGARIECVDLGGGWTPGTFWSMLRGSLPQAVATMQTSLPHLRRVILEPGKSLAQPSFALLTSVLEIRDDASGRRDVVVDGSIAEVPLASAIPHRAFVFSRATQTWRPLGSGTDRVLGRLCMEDDVVLTRISLDSVEVSDLIAICDVGAYDMSMSYSFGRGGSRRTEAPTKRMGTTIFTTETD